MAEFDGSNLAPTLLLAAIAGLLGLVAGWLIERSHFCTMGAISDAYLFGSLRRLRAWGLAIGVALLLTQLLVVSGLVPLADSGYRNRPIEPLGLFLGGLLFGVGMVFAGGCVSRNLVRLGSGSLKALVVLLLVGMMALATTGGLLAWLADALRQAVVWPLHWSKTGLGGVIVWTGILRPVTADVLLACLLGLALVTFALKEAGFRRSRADMALGFGLGTIVALGFLATGWLMPLAEKGGDVASLTFVAPIAAGSHWLMAGRGVPPGAAVVLVFATAMGAALSAWRSGRLRIETFASRDDMIRHVVGGGLMGFGGILAYGCTVGQGISGIATMAIGSFIAMAGIVVGALLALRRLERGGWRAALGLGTCLDPLSARRG